jgi:hypothetical protein
MPLTRFVAGRTAERVKSTRQLSDPASSQTISWRRGASASSFEPGSAERATPLARTRFADACPSPFAGDAEFRDAIHQSCRVAPITPIMEARRGSPQDSIIDFRILVDNGNEASLTFVAPTTTRGNRRRYAQS